MKSKKSPQKVTWVVLLVSIHGVGGGTEMGDGRWLICQAFSFWVQNSGVPNREEEKKGQRNTGEARDRRKNKVTRTKRGGGIKKRVSKYAF